MIITLIAWLYISFVCWTWGVVSFALLKKLTGIEGEATRIHPCITCFTGLAVITTFFSIVSLFYPLGGWPVQVCLLLPSLFVLTRLKYKKNCKEDLASVFRQPWLLLTLGGICILLVLVMSTAAIGNQDTLAYHAQIIKWIENYKAIPGLANLHLRYGFQSSWFVSCALFSFNFLKLDALTFINSTVLVWYIIFTVSQINGTLRNQPGKSFFLQWLLLLAVSLWSYTQVRLAATSGSPDFIVTLYCWLIFHLLLSQASGHQHRSAAIFFLIIVLSVFTLTLKLSAIPIVLLWLYSNYQLFAQKKTRIVLLAFFISLAIAIPSLTRNVITSGYILFPSEFPDVADFDWKIQKERTILLKDYTTAYARLHSTTAEENDLAMKLSPRQWIPRWWNLQSLPDKLILLTVACSIFMAFFRLRTVLKKNAMVKAGILTSLAGILFWFVIAPDPRFGFGFIITFPAIIFIHCTALPEKTGNLFQQSAGLIITAFSVVMLGYTIYRFAYFSRPSQIIAPRGIENVRYDSVKCGNHILIIPEISNNCGTLNLPCAYDSCLTFEPRGTSITEGFRPK